ncbi:STAS domain-containing protein [Kineococcus terrestris]|uniref:STAS domain-containing protein n=1 Tax=Kineococcus terrestris TaxID=2044856 RepID=UPI0034DAC583
MTGERAQERATSGSVRTAVDAAMARVVLAGEVDAALGEELERAVADVGASGLPVVVDTRGVTFMDSTGVGFLARLAVRVRPHRVQVLDPPPVVRFLLQTTRVATLVDLVPGEGPLPHPPAA